MKLRTIHDTIVRPMLVLSLLSLQAIPLSAGAQQAAGHGAEATRTGGQVGEKNVGNTPVDVNAEEARLSDVVKLLMTRIGANYTLDGALRGATVTAHLNRLRFSIALEAVLRASTIPAQAELVDGVYHIRLRVDPVPPIAEPVEVGSGAPLAARFSLDTIKVDFIEAGMLARLLGGTSFATVGQTFGFVPYSLLDAGLTLNPGANAPVANGGANTSNQPVTTSASSFFANGGGVLILNRGAYGDQVGSSPNLGGLNSPLLGTGR